MEVVIPQSPGIWGGYFKFLDVAKQSALAYGNTVSVLEPFPCPAVDEFRKHYVHSSPNPDWFEKWCFEQWLLLAQWMCETSREVVFKIDSDCLIFCDLQSLWESLGRPKSTSWVPDSFITKDMALCLSDFIVDTFRLGKALERCEPGCCLCDGHLLHPYKTQLGTVHVNNQEQAIDSGLFNLENGRSFEGHKDIWFVQGQPCWIRPNGYTRMLAMHCWGDAKKKMDVIWQQSRQSLGGAPVRLSIA